MLSASRAVPGSPKFPPFLLFQHPKSISKLKLKTLVPTATELEEAISTLAWAMDQINVQWGLMSGSAVFLYARSCGFPSRLTADIDMLIQPNPATGVSAERVARFLCRNFPYYFATRRIDGKDLAQVRVPRGDREVLIDVDIYDHFNYEDRRADYDLRLPGNSRVIMRFYGQNAVLMHPVWLLRWTIRMWMKRRKEGDKLDILTLCDCLDERSLTWKVRGERDTRMLKGFLQEFEHDPEVLAKVIICPKIFGPWYQMKWIRRTLAGFLFIAAPLALDFLTSAAESTQF